MTPVPTEFAQLRRAFPLKEVRIGYAGIALEDVPDIPAAQKGYSVIPAGQTTDWEDSWLAVGHETSFGDPVFIDTEGEGLPVYTAPHGEGTWNPSLIAPSAEIFFTIIRRLSALAKNRENPVAIRKNPISESEIGDFRAFLAEFFEDGAPLFWLLMVEPPSE